MSVDLYDKLRQISTATISMQLLKRGIRAVSMIGVAPLRPGFRRVAGPAYTLRFLPFREDIFEANSIGDPDSSQRQAIEHTPAGAILVIDARGAAEFGVLGDILAARLQYRGVEAVVTDGGVRDAEAVLALDFPVFAGGAAAPASYNGFVDGGLEMAVACGGVTVVPGDVIVADEDGAIVIPAALAAEVADAGLEQERLERFLAMEVKRGASIVGTYPPDDDTRAAYQRWLDAGEPEG